MNECIKKRGEQASAIAAAVNKAKTEAVDVEALAVHVFDSTFEKITLSHMRIDVPDGDTDKLIQRLKTMGTASAAVR